MLISVAMLDFILILLDLLTRRHTVMVIYLKFVWIVLFKVLCAHRRPPLVAGFHLKCSIEKLEKGNASASSA